MKVIIPLLVGTLALNAQAQFESQGTKLYESEGKLLTLRIVPGEGSAKVYLVGKKMAEARVAKTPRLLSVRRLGPAQGKVLFRDEGDYYVLTPAPEEGSRLKLRVRVGKEEEEFRLQIKP